MKYEYYERRVENIVENRNFHRHANCQLLYGTRGGDSDSSAVARRSLRIYENFTIAE